MLELSPKEITIVGGYLALVTLEEMTKWSSKMYS